MRRLYERIIEIADYYGITPTKLEREIGASKGVITKTAAKGGAISSEWLIRLAEYFPLMSAEWLLRGEGDMLLKHTHVLEPGVPYGSDVSSILKDKDRIITLQQEKIERLEAELADKEESSKRTAGTGAEVQDDIHHPKPKLKL